MMKLKALAVSFVLVIITLLCFNQQLNSAYQVEDNSVRYGRQVEKNYSREILTSNLDANTLAVFGSSDLAETFKESFDPSVVFNYKDFHLMHIGRGNYRNIVHAAIMGSIGDALPQQKAVLVQSFQWFTPDGIPPDGFLSRISLEHVYNTMQNDKIKPEHKRAMIDRMIELSEGNKAINEEFRRYKKVFLDEPDNAAEKTIAAFNHAIEVTKNKYKFMQVDKDKLPLAGDKTPDYDWDAQMAKVTEEAPSRTDNNPYKSENHYYDEYIRQDLASLKDSDVNGYSDDSPEFKDLGIALDIAEDLGVKLKVAIMPVNGKWYDYMGMTAEKRAEYYKKLKQVLSNRNVEVLDYSAYEYEDYFLYDVMHLGWKGWTLFEKDLYNFAKQD